jgi:hypothetical protein
MHNRNVELLLVLGSCLAVTMVVCHEFGPDELVKSGLITVLAGAHIAVYRLWQGSKKES